MTASITKLSKVKIVRKFTECVLDILFVGGTIAQDLSNRLEQQ